MNCVVKIPELNTIYYLPVAIPAESGDWKIEKGAWVEVPRDIAD